MDQDKAIVMGGHLGWSNTRGGVEIFARQEDGGSGRWGQRARYSDRTDAREMNYGDLLTDHLENAGAHEGQAVIVMVLPGRGLDVPEDMLESVRKQLAL